MAVRIYGISGGGVKGKGYPVDTVVITRSVGLSNSIELQWIDPEDTTLDAIVFARWAGTKVVRKVGSAPTDPEDGVLVIDSRVRNQYKDEKYVDLGLEPDTTYYYRFFTYTDTGVLNTDFDGITKVQTKYFSEVFGENTFEQIHFVISQNLHKEIWNIGDKIKIWFDAAPGLAVQKGEYPSSGFESFDVPAGYVEFMIADFDKKMRWKDQSLVNAGNQGNDLEIPYEVPENPRNIVLVQSMVSEMLTFPELGKWDDWMYPFQQTYLEQWIEIAESKVRDLTEEDVDKYFEGIDEHTYYYGNLGHLGGDAQYFSRFKFFRYVYDIDAGYTNSRWGERKKLAAFPDNNSIIFRKESGEAVRFFPFYRVYAASESQYTETGSGTQDCEYSPEYSRIWCALK